MPSPLVRAAGYAPLPARPLARPGRGARRPGRSATGGRRATGPAPARARAPVQRAGRAGRGAAPRRPGCGSTWRDGGATRRDARRPSSQAAAGRRLPPQLPGDVGGQPPGRRHAALRDRRRAPTGARRGHGRARPRAGPGSSRVGWSTSPRSVPPASPSSLRWCVRRNRSEAAPTGSSAGWRRPGSRRCCCA